MTVTTEVRRVRIEAEARSQIQVLADEIRRRRRERDLSLEALASLSGVSRSMISKIERGEAAPSTVVLSRLAEALGVTFSRLMSPATEVEVLLIPASRQPVLRDEASGFLRRCLSPVLPGRGIDWVLNTLPPGATTGEFVAHRRGVSEYIFVLKGRLRATIGDRAVVVEEGDSLYFEADAGHTFTNLGAEACQYFLVIDATRLR
ncbi:MULTISPECIES: XRE family transcriptional regulator [unclassified Methylobacterium]|uniref:helix-turn-helix domain-containing protein n=1 Tax=unclassified Methylobacterium TaxID=2615210 RepID=UPI0011C1F5A6|nr:MULTISPECIES: XRE family transcriptional regulator [unclassified Methylobacterium]QEE41174.1 helix-turn-helix domain-containing protein [Methylobacterium sp. WL1]TXN03801.1 helix-turn-helix domain-containing protein [Methylobacterium sp. WL64]TXN56473.1 helix-turn-helix domain-containing protein [Methylobacterium sp. WL2]